VDGDFTFIKDSAVGEEGFIVEGLNSILELNFLGFKVKG